MSIPIATTTIRVWRTEEDPDLDRDEQDMEPGVVASGVRAVISSSRRNELGAGSQEVVFFRLTCDVVDLRLDDRVEDERTGALYDVIGPRLVHGFGAVASHTRADLKQITGVVSTPRATF